MSYFAVFPPLLQQRHLKIAIVFNYEAFRFEAWLAARNRRIQRQYWDRLKDAPPAGYRLVTPGKGIDSILECDLAAGFALDEPKKLTTVIERKTKTFIDDIEEYLRR